MAKKSTKRAAQLRDLIAYHQVKYHQDDNPEISDEAYDSLVAELRELEGVTEKEVFAIGAAPSAAFTKVKHQVRQWSFSNVFSYEELVAWETRIYKLLEAADITDPTVTYVSELKIDGLKVILEYQAGQLVRAATRGDGVTGEDVTHTVRTIADVPETLPEAVDMIVVGEVWLSKTEFARINEERKQADEPLFANPRNAAAGSLRQLDPEVAASRRLSMFCYDIDRFAAGTTTVAAPQTQWDELQLLTQLGFRVNQEARQCKTIKQVQAFYDRWVAKRTKTEYGVDGVVIKVNAHEQTRELGYTAKSPRFGTAYKFPATQVTTLIEDVQLQVGRTGVITPVAHLKPVFVDGSTVSRATLHNEDEIKRLDVRVGDTVILEKAGDIIPKIKSVLRELRPASAKPYRFPKKVDGCGGDGAIERIPGEAAYRCVERTSDVLLRQQLYHFVSKSALNMDGVGPRIIDLLLEEKLISNHIDLFTLTTDVLEALPGFQAQAANNVIQAITDSRTVSMDRFLVGLSIDGVGEEVARLIATRYPTIDDLMQATTASLQSIHGVGTTVAEAIVSWLADPDNVALVEGLRTYITITQPAQSRTDSVLNGTTLVFTGTLTELTRDEAKALARSVGATVASSVSAKTDYVVAGANAGSKRAKAASLGVKIVSEAEFRALAGNTDS